MIGSVGNVHSVRPASAGLVRAQQGGSTFTQAITAVSAALSDEKTGPISRSKSATASDDGLTKLQEALAAFKKEASLTPAQRARRDVLKSMKLSEDAIDAMPPDQRKATEQKIADEVARRLRLKDAGKDQAASFAALQA